MSQLNCRGESIPERGDSKCKGPGVGVLACSRNIEMVRWLRRSDKGEFGRR